MLTAVLYGLAASSALIIGALIGAWVKVSKQVTGVLLAFASGALIAALAFELFEDAFELGGATRSGLGLLAGAAAFVAADTLLDRRVTGSVGPDGRAVAGSAVGWSLLAAVTLDGVPENLALGVSLVEGASLTLLVAIFASNLPEALVGAAAMRDSGRSPMAVLGIWTACAVLLALAVSLGFAGGAVLASLADTLMPEAFENGRPYNAFATAAGFFLSFVLAA